MMKKILMAVAALPTLVGPVGAGTLRETAVPAQAATNVVVVPEDNGAALINPGMGWVMHYYDNSERYGTTIKTGDDLRWFP